ncbi:MAG TPA: ABC transporter permease, partial [Blastocatellia bacterium]|nr:ABC transporter permease [Blastocatellia bacterium]
MAEITKDVRFAVRTLIKKPGFTTVAVITMALGIGANAAIFSVISGVLLKSLPYRDADRIMFVLEKNESRFKSVLPMSSLNYRDLKEQSHSFEFMGARRPLAASLMSSERPERIQGEQVTSDYFRVLGVNPLNGREFAAEEQKAGGAPVALISDGL